MKVKFILITILITAIATLGIQKIFFGKEDVTSSINYGQLMQVSELSLVTQTNNYSHLTNKVYKFKVLGSTRLYCEWVGTTNYGIDSLSSWKWNIKYNDKGYYTVDAPKIKLLSVNLNAVNCTEVKKGGLVDSNQFRNDKEKYFQLEAEEKAREKLLESELQRICRLSLENYILNFLNQANPENKASAVIINFIE